MPEKFETHTETLSHTHTVTYTHTHFLSHTTPAPQRETHTHTLTHTHTHTHTHTQNTVKFFFLFKFSFSKNDFLARSRVHSLTRSAPFPLQAPNGADFVSFYLGCPTVLYSRETADTGTGSSRRRPG